jgi:vacuolar-type H+-ATPase subunit E/Vma4
VQGGKPGGKTGFEKIAETKMAEELKGLIEKIQEEGVRSAEAKASEIIRRATAEAAGITAKAKKDADKAVADAKTQITRLEDSSRATLKQAGRDFMLTLRKEILSMLDKLVASHVHKALTAEELIAVIMAVLKGCRKDDAHEIIISMKREDLEKLEKAFLNELRSEIKKGITLKPSDDVHGGFMISYDSGKSYYDFTDKALAKYLSTSLKPALAGILDNA